MAVVEMKKFTAICPFGDHTKLIKRLMWLSCVDIKQRQRENEEGITFEKLSSIDTQIAEKSRLLEKTKEAMKILAMYDSKKWEKQITLKTKRKLFSPPAEIDYDEFMESGRYDVALSQLDKIMSLWRLLSSEREEYNSLCDEKSYLGVWQKYDNSLKERSTEFCDISFFKLWKKASLEMLSEELSEKHISALVSVDSDKHSQYAILISHKSTTESAIKYLLSRGGVQMTLPCFDGSVDKAIEEIDGKIEKNLNKTRLIEEQIASFVGFESRLCIVHDILTTNIVELEQEKKILKTGGVCIIDGWVPSASLEKVQGVLERLDCAYEFSDPEQDEDVPVLIKNNPFATAFEPVVSLYSLPKYKTFDPTFIMSFFYVIIFGLMFADVGYGIILTIGCLLALKLIYPRGTVKKFFIMFAICGISCAVWGVILGGYFGDFPTTVLGIEGNIALWFDPIQDPMTFLVLSIVVGAVHMITGMVIKMVILIKRKEVFSAIFDIGSWVVIFIGIGIAIISLKIGLITALVGVLMLILTQGRAQKNIIMKLVKGVGSLYSITSYASDLLSYTRILSLGLASAVIAKVVNVIATLGGDGIVGYLLLIIVLLIGHALNMAINLLGTFVHASRLQYIEFFGKFYEEGGTPFNVVAPKMKYVILKKKKDI